MDEIFQALAFVPRVHYIVHFIFLIVILCDSGGTRSHDRLPWEMIVIGFYTRDVNDWMNAHGAGKTEFNGIGTDQLHDCIRSEPSFRKLPGGMRKMEVVG